MNGTVYVVDDEPRVRESVTDLLSSVVARTESFASTEDFLTAFCVDPQQPQCVIADLRMPGLSGLDLKREMIERQCDIPVILLTGYLDDETTARAEGLGIFEILEKPYPPPELIGATRRALASCKVA